MKCSASTNTSFWQLSLWAWCCPSLALSSEHGCFETNRSLGRRGCHSLALLPGRAQCGCDSPALLTLQFKAPFCSVSFLYPDLLTTREWTCLTSASAAPRHFLSSCPAWEVPRESCGSPGRTSEEVRGLGTSLPGEQSGQVFQGKLVVRPLGEGGGQRERISRCKMNLVHVDPAGHSYRYVIAHQRKTGLAGTAS